MESWCPRCEWLGTAAGASCPRCATPLLGEPVPTGVAVSSGSPLATLVPEAERLTTSSGSVWESFARAGSVLWPVVPVLVVLALASGGLAGGGGEPTGETAAALGLPPRLARVSVGTFAWSSEGALVVVDASGTGWLTPWEKVVGRAVRDVAFSPDGEFLAVCSGWPPKVDIVPVHAPTVPRWPHVEGCDPTWSADSRYVSYRLATTGPAGRFERGVLGTVDIHVGTPHVIMAGWPVAWASEPAYRMTPLAAPAPTRDAVELHDPTGRTGRVLLTAVELQAIAGRPRLAPITLLAWSPDGSRLAVGFGGRSDRVGGVMEVILATRRGTFISAGFDLVSVSWSPTNDLLAEFSGPGGGVTRLLRADGRFLEVLNVSGGTWSPDGRWILALGREGWVAIDVADTARELPVGATPSPPWVQAAWCCPPAVVARPWVPER